MLYLGVVYACTMTFLVCSILSLAVFLAYSILSFAVLLAATGVED
jgi:hypothetical protein